MQLRKVVTSSALPLNVLFNGFQGFNLTYIILFFFMQRIFVLLIRDVCSGAASMEVLVCLTRKSKRFYVRVNHLGVDADVKLDWVIITC